MKTPVYEAEDIKAYLLSLGVPEHRLSYTPSQKEELNYVIEGNIPYDNSFSKEEAIALAEKIYKEANIAAAQSWGETLTDTSETPVEDKVLASDEYPVNVRFKGQDAVSMSSIKVDKVTEGNLPQGIKSENLDLYDIKPLDTQGQFKQISEEAVITIALRPGRRLSKVIYYLPETSMIENLQFEWDRVSNTVSFTVSHFSYYGLVYEDEAVSVDEPKVDVPKVDKPKTDSPKSETSQAASTVSKAEVKSASAAKPAKADVKQLPKTGEVMSILSLLGAGFLGLAGLSAKKRQ